MAYTTLKAVIDAVTATTTSSMVGVGDRVSLSLQFIATQVTSGSGKFQVQVSNDGSNWIYYNRLNDNLTNTNGQFDTRVASSTLSANGNKVYFFPAGDHFNYLRINVLRTTDGTYTALLHTVVPN